MITIKYDINGCSEGCPDFKIGAYIAGEHMGDNCSHKDLDTNVRRILNPLEIPEWCPRRRDEHNTNCIHPCPLGCEDNVEGTCTDLKTREECYKMLQEMDKQ